MSGAPSRWLYHRIFADPEDPAWYYKIINRVIRPFVERNGEHLEDFFFFHYYQRYEPEPACKSRFERKDEVAYVRFRALVPEEVYDSLNRHFVRLVEEGEAILGSEECDYDLTADLGRRFGDIHLQAMLRYLNACASLMLSLVTAEDRHEDPQKTIDAIHLAANTLDFSMQGIGRIGRDQFEGSI